MSGSGCHALGTMPTSPIPHLPHVHVPQPHVHVPHGVSKALHLEGAKGIFDRIHHMAAASAFAHPLSSASALAHRRLAHHKGHRGEMRQSTRARGHVEEESARFNSIAAPTLSGAVTRLRIVHFNDVYLLDHLPRLKTAIDKERAACDGRLVVTLSGDFLAPSLLSALDQGRGDTPAIPTSDGSSDGVGGEQPSDSLAFRGGG